VQKPTQTALQRRMVQGWTYEEVMGELVASDASVDLLMDKPPYHGCTSLSANLAVL